ncbi:MAG: OmpA family protein [Acetobacteraceae bacterium]|nr:OmpA family protein [Acetobacteraceae bacterium]
MRAAASRLALLALLVLPAACANRAETTQRFPVFFQEWSAALDQPATNTVAAAANWAQEHPNAPVTVNGYADPEGSQKANIAMSRTRAQVVADQLQRDGVARDRIRMTAQGPTDFQLSALESRRVEILIPTPR